jgi:hypothetical protein
MTIENKIKAAMNKLAAQDGQELANTVFGYANITLGASLIATTTVRKVLWEKIAPILEKAVREQEINKDGYSLFSWALPNAGFFIYLLDTRLNTPMLCRLEYVEDLINVFTLKLGSGFDEMTIPVFDSVGMVHRSAFVSKNTLVWKYADDSLELHNILEDIVILNNHQS